MKYNNNQVPSSFPLNNSSVPNRDSHDSGSNGPVGGTKYASLLNSLLSNPYNSVPTPQPPLQPHHLTSIGGGSADSFSSRESFQNSVQHCQSHHSSAYTGGVHPLPNTLHNPPHGNGYGGHTLPKNNSNSNLNIMGDQSESGSKNQRLMMSLLQSSLNANDAAPSNGGHLPYVSQPSVSVTSGSVSVQPPPVQVAPPSQVAVPRPHSLSSAENAAWTESFHDLQQAAGAAPTSGSSTGGNADKDPSRARKISDAQTYGPRFSILYENYRSKFNLQIDTRRHLMSLCVEHMVNFVKWARESELQCSWISNILLENDYLRPEVRNGVVMVLIYTFASIKAVTANNANNSSRGPSSPVPDSNSSASSNIIDMFSTLQDHERGLGIANKFSLKIYNDPYNFLSFLKTSISALIDAGIIPDNERQNQPKRLTTQSNSAPASVASSVIPPAPTALSAGNIMNGNKLGYQNREELQAFTELSKMLIDLLDSGNNTGARRLVLHVTSFWQVKGKFVRNRRFVTALNALSQPIQTSSLELGEFDADEVIPAFATESELKIMRSTASSSARGTVIAGCNNTIFPTNNITQAQMMLLDHQNSDDASPPVSPPSIPSICNKRSISDLSSVDASGTGKTMSGANKKKDKERDLERESTPSTAPVVPTSSPQSLISTNTPVQSRSTTSNNDETLSSTLKPKNISSVSLQALRFERVGPYEWEIKETRVFDCQKFAKMLLCNINPGTSSTVWNSSTNCGHTHYRTIALIDEVALFAVMERDNKAVADSNSCKKFVARKDPNRGDNQFGLVSLEHELQVCGALVTSWPAGELSQFEATLSSWKTHADRLHHLFARHIHTLQAIQQQLRDRGENVIQVSDEDFGIDDSIIGAPISELTGVLDVSSCTPEEQTVYSRLQTIEGKMKSNSLYHFWKYHTPSPSPSVPFLPAGRSVGPIGYIGYEVDMTMVMLIRANEQLGMTEDIWCTLYPKELQDLQGHNNFQSFLSSLFPQISHLEVRMNRRKEKFSNDQRDEDIEITNNIMVKYFAHRLTSSSASESDSDTTALIPGIDTMMTRIPPPVAAQYYKTIGTFATPPGRVIARFNPGPLLHDFILELL